MDTQAGNGEKLLAKKPNVVSKLLNFLMLLGLFLVLPVIFCYMGVPLIATLILSVLIAILLVLREIRDAHRVYVLRR